MATARVLAAIGAALLLTATVGGPLAAVAVGVATCLVLAALARTVAVVRATGLDVLLAVLIPSFLADRGVIDGGAIARLVAAVDLFAAFATVVIVGSILSLRRGALLPGAMRLVVPVVVASAAALAAGTVVGGLVGTGAWHGAFFVAVPVLGGGISAGAIPASVGYAAALGLAPGEVLARLLPTVLIGNLCAVAAAGLLAAAFGPGDAVSTPPTSDDDPAALVPGLAVIAAIHLAGLVAAALVPPPVTAFVLAAALHAADVLPARVATGIRRIYTVAVGRLVRPVLFCVGLVLVPWPTLVAGASPAAFATTLAVVAALVVAGLLFARTADGATLVATRAAMGGTGTIAILSAGRRMGLMPYAQLVTRVGGWVTTAAAIALVGL